MKRFLLNKISTVGTVFSLDKLLAGSKKKVICLLYHTVDDDIPVHIKHLYQPRKVDQFIADINFLSDNFQMISSEQLVNGQYPADKVCLHLSFDDGLKECFETIYPILKGKNIPATFFINPSFVDNKEMFHCHKASILKDAFLKDPCFLKDQFGNPIPRADFLTKITSIHKYPDNYYATIANQLNICFERYLLDTRPYMSMQQIQALQNDGFSIGGHTLTHVLLNDIDEKEKLKEIINSVDWVNAKKLSAARYFAFPFHDIGISKSIFESLCKSRINLSFGTSDLKDDNVPGHYHRINFENASLPAKEILKKKLFKYILLKTLNQHVIIRK